MVEQLRRQTEDVVRYYGEIDRRVANAGMDGIAGLLTVSQHVESALAVVGSQELEWIVREIRALLERLVRTDSQLRQLRALKTVLSDDPDDTRLLERPRS